MRPLFLSPNTQKDDVIRAVQMLFCISYWKKGAYIKSVRNWFQKKYNSSWIFLFASARGALYHTLKAYGIGKGDEVIIQAFTCVAVPEAIIATGATPVYADINSSYTIKVADMMKKISLRTKAVIIQHTFGISVWKKSLYNYLRDKNIIVIEDCSHTVNVYKKDTLIGSLGDASIFSFGRDKVISSVSGGACIFYERNRKKNKKAIIRMQSLYKTLPYPSYFWIVKQLLHPILISLFIIPFYSILIGKVILVLLQSIGILPRAVHKEEYQAIMPYQLTLKYPNALAFLLEGQLRKLSLYQKHRIHLVSWYESIVHKGKRTTLSLYPLLRYPLLVRKKKTVYALCKKNGVLLGRWYQHVIDPDNVSYKTVGYTKGSCPNAEYFASRTVNLPTHIHAQITELKKIEKIIRTYHE